MVTTLVEVQHIDNMMLLQDEFDKSSYSLWGLEEDCLSCSVDKYKPFIQASFKIACLSYKPSGIPFRGTSYIRKSMIEIKQKILMD